MGLFDNTSEILSSILRGFEIPAAPNPIPMEIKKLIKILVNDIRLIKRIALESLDSFACLRLKLTDEARLTTTLMWDRKKIADKNSSFDKHVRAASKLLYQRLDDRTISIQVITTCDEGDWKGVNERQIELLVSYLIKYHICCRTLTSVYSKNTTYFLRLPLLSERQIKKLPKYHCRLGEIIKEPELTELVEELNSSKQPITSFGINKQACNQLINRMK